MSIYVPYTKLFLGDEYSVAIAANGHILVLDSSAGEIIRSTSKSEELSEKIRKSGEVAASAVDADFKHLVTATSTKIVRVWNIPELRIVSEREAPKKPTDVCFTNDGQTILVSDKFGDVHRYPSRDSQTCDQQGNSTGAGSSDPKAVKKRISGETLVLGHVSLLTTLLLSGDEKYIITADRDEHIRVSWYPEAYTIEGYCLGHKKFVSALHIPPSDPSILVSGGGDPHLKIWNWMEGKLLREIPIGEVVMPFVKVVRKKSGLGDDGSDGESAPKSTSKGRRRGRKKRKGKAEADVDSDEEAAREGGEGGMQVDDRSAMHASANNEASSSVPNQEPSQPSPLLAVRQIATLESNSHRFIIFSAHGASALFYCKFPDLTNPSPSDVRSISFDAPVLGFALWRSADEIWVTVDANWSEGASSLINTTELVKVVKVSNDKLVLADSSTHQSLANSLNSTARIEESQESLKDIDLYAALVVLPKNVDAEHNAMDDEAQLSEATAQKLSGKELGRLKSKKAVLALQQAQAGKREQSETPDTDRTLKRQKSESLTEAE